MLMGVPGLAYTTGISGVWIAVGLTLGTWANWRFVSRRLRNHTEVASDSLTLPDYLKNRFHDQSHSVAVIFFFNDTATTEIYTLSLHDALPISIGGAVDRHAAGQHRFGVGGGVEPVL